MRTSKNLDMLAVVARGLQDLKDQVVFVGGAVVDLYITRPGVAPLRATDDVDCVVAITSRAFQDRGKGDFYGSPDIEDIVAILDGAEDFADKISKAPASVKDYLRGKFEELLKNDLFVARSAPLAWHAGALLFRTAACAGSRTPRGR